MLRFALPLLILAAGPAHAEDRRYMLTEFDRIRVDGPFAVDVRTGAASSASGNGEPRSLDALSLRVDGRTLVVAVNQNGWGGFPTATRSVPRVTVTTPVLRGATMQGGGTLVVDRMKAQQVVVALIGAGSLSVGSVEADRLEASLLGTGALTLGGRALTARFQSDGAGTIAADRLDVGTLTVNSQSAGDSRFAARINATVTAAGQGAVRVDGPAACIKAGPAPIVCGK